MKYKGAATILKEDTAMAPLITRLSIAALGAASLSASALQDPAAKSQDVAKGQTVRVLLTNGHVVEGQIINLTANALVLRVENLGTTVQKRRSIEKITDAESGTALGWKGVEVFEEEIKQRNTPPPPTVEPTPPTATPPTPPPSVAPPADPTADPGHAGRPEAVRQAEAVLKGWNEDPAKDTIKLFSDLRALDPAPARFLAKNLALMPGTHWSIAADALIRLKDPAVVEDLTATFKDPRTAVRTAALNVMIQLSPRPDPYVGDGLGDPDAGIRAAVVQAMGRQSAVVYLQEVGRMMGDPDDRVRRAAAAVLTERAPFLKITDLAADWVVDALAAASTPSQRLLCVETLGALGTDGAVDALDPLVTDDDAVVGQAAARSLGRIRTLASRRAVAAALDRVDDEAEPELVLSLVQAALSVKSRGSLPRLIALLESANPALVKSAHQALEAISNTRGLPPSPERWGAWFNALPEALKDDAETPAPAPEEQP